MYCRFKACGKCGGDLVNEGEDWRCWQCGRYYYPQRTPAEFLLDPAEIHHPLGSSEWSREIEPHRKRRKARRAVRRVNSVIAATARSEENWWNKNRLVIGYLEEGKPVQEISQTTGCGPRQIRIIRERLCDHRDSELAPMAAD